MKPVLSMAFLLLGTCAVNAQGWTHDVWTDPVYHTETIHFDGTKPAATSWSATLYKVQTFNGMQQLSPRETDSEGTTANTTYNGKYLTAERDPVPGNWNYQLWGGHFKSKLYSNQVDTGKFEDFVVVQSPW